MAVARQVVSVCLAGLCSAAVAVAQPPTVRIPKVTEPPTLDDIVSARRTGDAVIADFRQRQPGDGDPASQKTTAYLSYDERNLYVGFVCEDAEPSKVRAQLSRREAVFNDDRVVVALDTFNDKRRAYLFMANPLGIQADAITTEGQGDDFSFDTLWHSTGRLTPQGYAVLLVIPYKSLRFDAAAQQTWGLALGRSIPRSNETSWWPAITTRVTGFTNQFATAEGLANVSPGRNMQLIPYAAFAGAKYLDETSGARVSDADPRVGFDAKVVLRDAITVDAAVNPDFSQVESDSPQVTVNQRFEVFFPEKRPFFIENAGLFQTPGELLFFSRRIADPQFGGRVTGKVGRWTLAGLGTDDRAPGQRLSPSSGGFGAATGVGVLRVQREVGKESNIGAMVTSRDFAGSSNRVAAVDTRLKLNSNWVLNAQGVTSDTKQLDGRTLSGTAFNAALTRSSRALSYLLYYTDRDPEFRAQLGFVPRTDIRDLAQFVTYRWRPRKGPFVSLGPNSYLEAIWNHQGELTDWIVRLPMNFEMKGETFVFVRRVESFERFGGLEFRENENLVNIGTNYWKRMSIFGSVATSVRPNFYPAAGLAPFRGEGLDAQLDVVLRPKPQVTVEALYIYSRLQDNRRADATDRRVFDNHIVRSRLGFQFTREMSLRAIVDYNAVLSNAALIGLERTKRVTGDLLFTYLLNPGTALYVGYTDGYENLLVDRMAAGNSLRRAGNPATSVGRQLFVKTSYLFRF